MVLKYKSGLLKIKNLNERGVIFPTLRLFFYFSLFFFSPLQVKEPEFMLIVMTLSQDSFFWLGLKAKDVVNIILSYFKHN